MSLLVLFNQPASGGGITGAITATQAGNTAALTGTVTASGISGVITAQQSDNTAQLSGLSDGVQTFSNEVELLPKRNWYVKRKKQILIFDSAQEADAFIAADELAEQAIAQAQKTSRRARKRLRERVYSANPVQPIESVDIDQLGALVDRYQMAIDLPDLIAQQDFERVMQIMALAMEMQEEDDIEMLLLC